jgi:ribonuclease Z
MPKLIILGSSNAIPDETHENTYMALVGNERTLLIDCANNPFSRFRSARLNFHEITDMILTHFHPDHVSGVPVLLMDMWLLGRKRPLDIYGLHHTLDRIEDLMGFYNWEHWPNFFPVTFHRLPQTELIPVLENNEFRVFASPVRHLMPTIGVRIELLETGKVLAYSCDTEPCPNVVELAADADVLIHEATGATPGHTSGAQAGSIARQADARRLYLIHYPTGDHDPRPLVDEARKTFGGEVYLAEDLMEIEV